MAATAGVALPVTPQTDPLQSGIDFGKLAAFHFGELAPEFHLLGGERGIEFVSHAGFMQIL